MVTIAGVEFDVWLRQKMAEQGVDRPELIRRLSRPGEQDQRKNVYKWLSGIRVPRYDKCQAIADALGVPQDEALAAAGYIHAPQDSAIEQAAVDALRAEEIRRMVTEPRVVNLEDQPELTPEEVAQVRKVLTTLREVDVTNLGMIVATLVARIKPDDPPAKQA